MSASVSMAATLAFLAVAATDCLARTIEAPERSVIVRLPASTRSVSALLPVASGPTPTTPFSVWKNTSMPCGM